MGEILHGKTAIVTGASSGIGAEVAEALGGEGANVVLVGRDEARLQATSERVASTGASAEVVQADITEDGASEEIVARAISRFDSLTTLVNCAGAFEMVPLEEALESLDRQWRINVRAPFDLTRVAVPHMRPGGSVMFFSSVTALVGYPQESAYAASKGAIISMARALAIEEAPNDVRVNCIIPGVTRTPMNEAYFSLPGNEASFAATIPLGRLGTPQDVTSAVVFLASDGSRYMTATSIRLDGGLAAS